MDEQKIAEQNNEELMGNNMTEENMVNEPVIAPAPAENKASEMPEDKSRGGIFSLIAIIIILILGGIYLWKMSNKDNVDNIINDDNSAISDEETINLEF